MSSTPPPLHVTIDDRERHAPILNILRAREDVLIHRARLSLGDYLWEDRLLFERKTWRDFGASLKDGRLLSQAWRLRTARGRAALIIESGGGAAGRTGLSRAAIQGALATITLAMGLPVLTTIDAADSAALMVIAARQLHQEHGPRRPTPPIAGTGETARRRRQVFILEGIPGIGPRRAARLLDRFGSIRDLAAATDREWCQVPDIGPKVAHQLGRLLREDQVEYQVTPPPKRKNRTSPTARPGLP